MVEPKEARTSSSGPHAYVGPEDDRIGLMGMGTNPDFAQQAQIEIASSTVRETPCRLPGCGKPKDDPIHTDHDLP